MWIDHLQESGWLTRGRLEGEEEQLHGRLQVKSQEKLGLRPLGGAEEEACGAALFGWEVSVRPDNQERLPGGGGLILLSGESE